MEIERKYLIDEIPFDLKDYSCKVIEQGYLNTDPVVRCAAPMTNIFLLTKAPVLWCGKNIIFL